MEKVKVIKPIAGILKVGDTLISPVEGADFCLEEVNVTSKGSNERFISLDYVTVSENVPYFFEFEKEEEPESECYKCGACEDCDCTWTLAELMENGIEFPVTIERSIEDIDARYQLFTKRFHESPIGSEAQVVYKNLMWFIEWLYGKQEIL